ncbi:transposase [Pustulibacterium marinum]|uniref:Transposase n=1 Tax=Pustulibacterium marinum TaxID=1224947 RepID=A0A1I7IBS5_9FLAO|nr:transposase [Pustulibacterium marinum]
MKERRHFTREFKINTVELSYTRDNIKELAHELNVRPELIYRWRSEFTSLQEHSFPGNGKAKMTEEESELARLKKELSEVKMECDILKKAVGIFSKSDGKNFNL